MHSRRSPCCSACATPASPGWAGQRFPTATKLALARSRGVTTLLLNGAECEPWICCDDALLRSAAADVVQGAQILAHALGASRTVIAVEDDKPAAIEAVQAALAAQPGTQVALVVLPALYPQGAERQLITAVTGIEVPAGALPQDAGVLCQNVATAAAVAHWARTGLPLLTRIVTVTGSGVARPCNVRAAFGTPLAQLVAAAGGYRGTPLRLIAGGNMTGRALPSDEVGLTKAINCVLVATRADLGAASRGRGAALHPLWRLRRRVPGRTAAAATAARDPRRRAAGPARPGRVRLHRLRALRLRLSEPDSAGAPLPHRARPSACR